MSEIQISSTVISEKIARPLDGRDLERLIEVNPRVARRLARHALERGLGKRIDGRARFSLEELTRIAGWPR